MPLSAVRDDQFTAEEGELVEHWIGLRCPCADASGKPDPNCTEHELGGWIYRAETTIRGLVTDVRQSKELSNVGLWLPGDCVFSPPSNVVISDWDKVVFTWALPHGAGDVRTRGMGASDLLNYAPTRAIYCEDEDQVRYLETTDFRFSGKTIEWDWDGKDGAAPAAGKRYTVKYLGYLEWIVFLPPFERVSAGERIGQRVQLRKKHLVET